MKPVKRHNPDFKYELVPVNTFVAGTIEEIQRDEARVTRFEGKESVNDMVRLKFKLDGLKFARYSKWMTFSYGSKASLYKNILVPLVKDAKADMDFDLSTLVGKRVNTFWTQKGEYQNLQLIVPLEDGVAVEGVAEETEESPI